MKAARIVVLVVAVGAGGLAALLAGRQKVQAPPPQPVAQLATTEVLIAKSDIGIGQALSPGDLQWQTWPAAAASSYFIRRDSRPNAMNDVSGSIARAPFVSGEPIRESKLVKADGSGFMAAILPPGMRAVSTVISPETGAGGFILPNDHVDVILSRRDPDSKAGNNENYISETVLRNIRVLAIDQTIEEKNGQKVVVGKTATLELSPHQAETLALSRQLGTLSLSLRSMADGRGDAPAADKSDARSGGINTVRFGVTTTTMPK